ncbi:MAG: protein kinase domain-containing protein [Candidatus Sulfotelmatobacter sp.]
MIDPKNQNYDPEAATFVPGGSSGGSPARTGNAVQTPLPSSPSGGSEAPTMLEGALPPMAPVTRQNPPPTAVTPGSPPAPGVLLLQPGILLGNRYQIIHMLGEGGMGAVYKAKDIELDRVIALKVIRPELASNPEILQRFKQELILARQVTDRNVIRIFDLGEANGIRFITMEYVEGESLYHILRRQGKVPVNEAVEMMRQMLSGLQAAHREGVIHRDLKPGNIMRDSQGRIVVMDFGLARSLEGGGMTLTGTMMGTLEYMSPEQAQAKQVDARSDIFTVGLICYELLAGVTPFHADSAIASLVRRTSERAIPVSDHDGTIPTSLSNIVSKCLERDPNLRYQNAGEVLRDIEAWQGNQAGATLGFQPAVEPWGRTIHWPLLTGIATVLLLALLLYAFRGKLSTRSKPKGVTTSAVSLAILPFRNASGDPAIDWLGPSLAEMLSTDVGQSASLRTVSQDRLHQVFSDLRIAPNSAIDPTTLRSLAEFSSADTVVWGQYAKFGDQIRVDATVQDLKRDRRVPLKIEGVAEKDIPGAIDRLADSIRQNLAVSSDMVKELKASSYQPSTSSVTALREYNEGVQLIRQGKNLEAVKSLQLAVKDDPQFALAYSRLAESEAQLGYDNDAEQHSRKAVDLAQQLPVTEKYLIQANHARITKDNAKGIEAYENLAKSMPDNTDVQFALGSVYEDSGNLAKASEHFAAVLKADPKNINALLASGRINIKNGDSEAALDPLSRALTLAVQVDNQEQKALVLLAMGIAYRVLNKPQDALGNYQQSLEINRKLGQKRGVAANLNEIAQVQSTLGKLDAALTSYKEALEIRRQIGAKKESGDILIDIADLYGSRGQYDLALEAYKQSLQIQRDAGDETYQAVCLNNIGNVYLNRGDNDNALTYLQQALQLREKLKVPGDIAETLHNVGEAYANVGQYEQAMSNYMRALDLDRKAGDNVAAAVLSHAMALVFASQGRYGAAVNAAQDAIKPLRDTGDKSPRMAQFLADFGDALARAGRLSEAAKPLEEADALARPLKNEALQALILNSKGDLAFYGGDLKQTKEFYTHALSSAARSNERHATLNAKINLAKVTLAQGHLASEHELRQLADQAEALGMRDLSTEVSVLVGQTMVSGKDYSHAREALERSLGSSEKLGMRMQTVKIQYLLGNSLRLSGDSTNAAGHYRNAARLLDEMKKDPGAEKLLERADLKSIYEEATQGSNPTGKK